MSVDRSDYIIYGWKLPFNMTSSNNEKIDFWDDKFLPYIEGHQGIEYSLIRDGMSGEYMVFGQRLSSGGDDYEGWDFVNLDFKNLDAEKVKTKYRKLFNIESQEHLAEPYLFIFSHFH